MAGVADKARFYLERSVPQLREWEQKEIFSKEEIRSIVARRSDFEHRCLASGVKPEDFTQYAAWELSLDALRKKRCERLKIRHVSSQHATQARVMAIYERALVKRPSAKELWLEYLGYCAKVKATKRWRKTMTRALRMMPRDADLWIHAGRRSARNGDMGSARGYFMRGCRFCTTDATLWVAYTRCEMDWLAKMAGKKKDTKKGDKVDAVVEEQVGDGDEILFDMDDDEDDENEDGVILPEPSNTKEKEPVFDEQAKDTLENNPALNGAIPMAIFDVAQKQIFFNDASAETFFNLFALYTQVSVQPKLLQHVLDSMQDNFSDSPCTWNCYIRTPLVGVSPYKAEFAQGLRDALTRLNDGLTKTSNAEVLKEKTAAWIDASLAMDGLDEAFRAVLSHTKEKLFAEPSEEEESEAAM